jgi:cell wall-associated NlpC family hydrolase
MSAPRLLGIGAAGLVLAATVMAGVAGVVSASLLGPGALSSAGGESVNVPAAMLTLYEDAAATCPGLPWTVLAAIGTVESDNGTSDLPGVHSGSNGAGAEGPMQFEPSTFAAYDQPAPPGGAAPPTPYDPTDAVYAAARMLCANGAAGGADLPGAIFAYNHDPAYVARVLSLAQSYAQAAAVPAATARTAGVIAVEWALAQVGTPYVWGGETPGVGFDCSGLAQAAYEVAGVTLPRVAQEQFDAGPQLPPGAPLAAGDLVFFGAGPTDVTHVGIYVGAADGRALMVDAPHTGADVRVEPIGSEPFVGATDPG